MWETWIFPLLFSAVNIALTVVLRQQFAKLEKKREAEKAYTKAKDAYQGTIARAVKALLHGYIYTTATTLLRKGHASGDEKQNLEYLYLPYKELGGNGTAEAMYRDVLELPSFERETKP